MDSASKDCLKSRIEYNSCLILNAEKENEELRHHLESEDAPIPITIEGKLRLLDSFLRKVLHAHYGLILEIIPPPSACRIQLISRRIGFDLDYSWWVLLPSEKVGGVHFKTIVVTDQTSLFSSRSYDKVFVETLKEKGLLTHIALEPPTRFTP
jgi:hypothetical protein